MYLEEKIGLRVQINRLNKQSNFFENDFVMRLPEYDFISKRLIREVRAPYIKCFCGNAQAMRVY
jgi:hypothetical protein